MTAPPVWIGPGLVLASRSGGRRQLLEAAGIAFETAPADIDERAIEREYFAKGGAIEGLAAALARAKAVQVRTRMPGALCLGADQVMTLEGEALHRSPNIEAARAQMRRLAGKTHTLTSAACVARDGVPLFEAEEIAEITMRPLDDEAIARYFALAGDAVLASVGGYQIEGLGVHLFEAISGNHATIVGLPMLALLAWFRRSGFLAL
jgi:septum formation protein